MEIVLHEFFVEQLQKCPPAFQQKFRKVYQQLKVVDKPLEVKGVVASTHSNFFYKLFIGDSRIGLQVKGGKLYMLCFLYNPYFES
ncbi:MAG TPA: hypothetical protein PKC39_05380 [Ferruginibacter sp.]|nr:hypothetical protein [Ferruginibacter sp.]HMP20373.1 hypothetical protein [Ferruginibacter sp.]